MVKHLVLLKLKPQAEGASRAENLRIAKTKLEALRNRVAGLVELEVGSNVDTSDRTYDLALYSAFESLQALAAYQANPEYREVADFLNRIGESRAVVDYEHDGGRVVPKRAEPAWNEERLLTLARSFQETRALLSGAELDLFTCLAAAPMTAPSIAAKVGADLRALTMLLDALAAMGLLIKHDGTYQTEPSAAELLSAGKRESVLPMVLHSANLWVRWSSLTARVGGPEAEKRALAAWQRSFIGAMHSIALRVAPRIVELVGPGSARRMLDVGGASGSYTQAFLAASASMRATLFDRAPVVEMARELLGSAGVLDRVTLVPGDFYADPLPGGHDLVFLSAIIHQNSPDQNIELFRKAFTALDPGGRIVVRDHVLTPDRLQPKAGALFAVNMLVAGNEGNSYTYDEIACALAKAGFERVRLLHPDTRMDGLVEAFKPVA